MTTTPTAAYYNHYKKQYSNDPRVWGPSAWRFIHTIALQYPNRPSADEKDQFMTFFLLLPHVLPCYQCGVNMSAYLQEHYSDFRKAFDSRDALFRWTVDFHRHVNSRERSPHNGDDGASSSPPPPPQQQQPVRMTPLPYRLQASPSPNQPRRTII